jgi:hypothetical protein
VFGEFLIKRLSLSTTFVSSDRFAFFENSNLYASNGDVILNLFFLRDFLPNSDQKSLDQLL